MGVSYPASPLPLSFVYVNLPCIYHWMCILDVYIGCAFGGRGEQMEDNLAFRSDVPTIRSNIRA